jgi:hypothetical protein
MYSCTSSLRLARNFLGLLLQLLDLIRGVRVALVSVRLDLCQSLVQLVTISSTVCALYRALAVTRKALLPVSLALLLLLQVVLLLLLNFFGATFAVCYVSADVTVPANCDPLVQRVQVWTYAKSIPCQPSELLTDGTPRAA